MILPTNQAAEYMELLPIWEHVRAAIKGKRGAIELIDSDHFYGLYYPAYRITEDNRINMTERKRQYFGRGRFFGATGATHDKYLGMVGSAPVDFTLPTKIEGMANDCDGENSTLNAFALEIVSEVLVTARYGVLSNPPTTAGKSNAAATGALPTMIGYKAERIIWQRVDKGKLQEVWLVEDYWCQTNDHEWEIRHQVRRLILIDGQYGCDIWRDGVKFCEDGEPETAFPTVNGKTLDYIPFQFYGSENNKPSYDRPVMFDLAHQNLGHFQLDCDNRDNLHYHGQGMTNLYIKDTDQVNQDNPTGTNVGAKGENIFGHEDRVEILQIAATGALAEEMTRDEKRLIMLGAQVVQDSSSTQTLGAKEIESNASTSQLKRIALNVGEGLTQNLKWCAEFVGASDDVSVHLNTKFVTDDLSPQDVQAVFAIVQGGDLPRSVLKEVSRKAGYTDKTDEELDDEIENEAQGSSEEVANMMLMIEQLTEQVNALSTTKKEAE